MQIVVGTESGQLKVVQCPSHEKAIPKIIPFEAKAKSMVEEASKQMDMQCSTYFPVDKSKSIQFMTLTEYEQSPVILLARQNGELDLWNPRTHALVKTLPVFIKETRYSGLLMLNSATCLVSNDEGDLVIVDLNEGQKVHSVSLHTPLSSLRNSSSHPHVVVYGGKTTDVCILDLNGSTTPPSTSIQKYKGFPNHSNTSWNGGCHLYYPWKASHKKKDRLGLTIPIWISDVQFLNAECTRVVTCTAFGELKFYLSTQSRQPVRVVKLGDHPFRSLCLASPDTLAVSTNHGQVYHYSFSKYTSLGTYKGATGAVSQVNVHDKAQTLVSVGLDRMIRTYNVTSRALTGKWFVKQRLQCVVFLNSSTESLDMEAKKNEQDEWDLLDALPQPSSTKKTKKRKENLDSMNQAPFSELENGSKKLRSS
ncbi:WD repeat-containing protein 74 [Coelomomyces lativittatus]|nr:WD repeat-containing protein 74 [Coelomomyces lativittatus]KAJ1503073.1 WD repeat-containing protein 74 [Coelomomyces lativittatus]KAJ1512439.1 WD repeat-containing protein 74 [Coelomomyces lativittatus]